MYEYLLRELLLPDEGVETLYAECGIGRVGVLGSKYVCMNGWKYYSFLYRIKILNNTRFEKTEIKKIK